MTVELITAATPEIHEAMGRLIPQLSRSAAPMSEADVQRFLSQDSVHLFAFRPDEADAQGNRPILGMLSLVAFEIPTGVRAWVEDVVVDEAARGQGAGFALVEAAVEHAKNVGARTVDLTSRPSREAANRLYQRAGFQLRETNVYRVTLEQK
ncbi:MULTISPECIES: GNAT family N-acetyltransferase [Actinomycetaceae]|uniref:GNAT family N-acetyltransferase n=1 Tax=Actinomycetaceae TaxID=2049 RepID=UPI00027331E6|nr:GNAT family N-acetyltransferase [Actinomyces sp. ICM47]EJG15267.1 acetyltransferase, GNAT family [Actinomyces sp. ICM47]